MSLTHRALAGVARRVERPELVATFYSGARQLLHETLEIELAGLEPGVIKIDVEGAELQVIEGGRTVLAAAKPFVIFEHAAAAAALYDSPSVALFDSLGELGYEIFTITGDGPYTRES